jgi:hypothetical protein
MWHRIGRPVALVSLAAAVFGAGFASCVVQQDSGAGGSAGTCTDTPTLTAAAPKANEWVSFHTEVPFDPAGFDALASGLFGADAQAGKYIKDKELTQGVFVSASAEDATHDQTRLTFAFDDGKNPRRPLAVAPASFAVGSVFIATVDAALAKMKADNAAEPGSGEQFYLEYRVASPSGGKLSFGVRGNGGVYSLVLDITSPHTSLEKDKIGTAADDFKPYDTVAGTVWFHLTKDDFDFFSQHAYGQGATSKQNFTDFKLVPHDWLRLTVDPHLDEKFVSVGFEVVTVDNKRIPVAKAPASILAGDAFQAMVNRALDTMRAQEKIKAGSSAPWQVPFYYDDPNGGGVVQVVAQGAAGQFSIAYAIESPRHPLVDVPFVAWQPVTLQPPDPSQTASCQDLGDPNIKLAPKGTLDIKFKASDTVLKSPDLKGPLKGTIYCSVFHKDDVDITGPKKDAKSLQDFNLPDADLQSMTAPTFVTSELYAGDYQVLCYQDVDKSGDASHGDPVTLPIGGYTVACNKNPVTVEFAILDPQ